MPCHSDVSYLSLNHESKASRRGVIVLRIITGLLLLSVALSASANSVGVATLVIGSPTIAVGDTRTPIATGSEITVGSQILTGTAGHVHLRFKDGTLVSVRPNSALKIIAFEGGANAVSSFRLELVSGASRMISGDGLKVSRERFRLNTPIAAIGIRGTDFTTQVSSGETRVKVHAGEVVMAPFGPGCLVDALGPCATDAALSLGAGAHDGMRLRAGEQMPELITGEEMSVSGVDERVSMRPAEPAKVERESAEETSPVNRVVVEDQVADFNVSPIPFIDTDDDLKEQNGALVWGHWFNKPEGDTWSQSATTLLGRFDPTVSNAVYGLFRDPSHAGPVSPARREVTLQLTAADATLTKDGFTSRARVSEGVLLLDFDSRAFVSKLSVDTDRAGVVSLEGLGAISSSGIFVSRSSSDRMAGAITTDGLEAGMLFEKRVGAGTVQGITLWGQ
jgi:hypothetical protein